MARRRRPRPQALGNDARAAPVCRVSTAWRARATGRRASVTAESLKDRLKHFAASLKGWGVVFLGVATPAEVPVPTS